MAGHRSGSCVWGSLAPSPGWWLGSGQILSLGGHWSSSPPQTWENTVKKDEGSVRHCPRSPRVLEEHDCTSSMWKSSWREPPPPAQLVTWEGPAITGVASRYYFLRCKGLSPTLSATSSPTALPFAFPEPQPSPYCGTVLKAPGHRSQPGPRLPSGVILCLPSPGCVQTCMGADPSVWPWSHHHPCSCPASGRFCHP